MDQSLEGVIRRLGERVTDISNDNSSSQNKKSPNLESLDFTKYDRSDIIVFGYDAGVAYGYDSKNVYKSGDDWVTKESIYEPPAGEEIRVVDYASVAKVLKNGKILFATSTNPRTDIYGYLWLSNEDRTSFTKVLTMPGGIPTGAWGFKDFGSLLFASEYAVLGRKAFMSSDGGLTWKMIYDRPLSDINTGQSCHIHDVGFDPYRNIVWLAFGDGDNRKTLYSHNFGEDWISLYTGYPPNDPIGILTTPNYTLFGSDLSPNRIDVLPHTDLSGTKFLSPDGMEKRWSGSKDGDTISLVANAMEIDGIYYFATVFSTARKIATIIATPNGWDFYNLLDIELNATGARVAGFINMFDDGEGNLRLSVKEDGMYSELIFKKPEWR